MSAEQALKAAAEKLVPYGHGPASVQQELHRQGILVSVEECRDAVLAVKAQSSAFFHNV